MDEIKIINKNYFEEIVVKTGFARPLLLKDYYLTLILYLIKDVNGIYFKGGTALNKIFLNHARLSEDIDFSLTREVLDVKKDNVFIDLNKRAKLLLPSETHKLNHFYIPFIPEFSIKTIAKEEMICEKVAATIGRNKPRDHYDVYMLLKKGVVIYMEMVKNKCHQSEDELSIIKMFNKAKMLKNRWDKDMI